MPPTPRRSSRASRALPIALAAGLIAAGAAVPPAAAGVTAPRRCPVGSSRSQTMQDPTGDADFAQGDMTSAGASAAANGITTLVVVVDQYESPLSDNWQLALTDVTWDLDLDGDGELDAYVVMIGVDDEVLAGVFEDADDDGPSDDDELLCDADAVVQRGARVVLGHRSRRRASATRPRSGGRATMTYEDHVTEVQSFDSAPDAGWAGPVTNDCLCAVHVGTDAHRRVRPPTDSCRWCRRACWTLGPGSPPSTAGSAARAASAASSKSQLEVAGRGGVPLECDRRGAERHCDRRRRRRASSPCTRAARTGRSRRTSTT